VVHDVQWVFAHVEGGVACFDLGMLEFGGGDVVARDNGGKAVGKFSKVKVRALVVWNLQGGE